MTKIKRIIKAGFINFKRGGSISFAAVLVVTITLSVITSLLLLQAVLTSSLEQVKNKVDVTVYFNVNASEEKILALKNTLEKLPEVAQVSYTTDEQALALFRARHENDSSTLSALDEIKVNPLGGYLNIKAKDISQYESIYNFLKSDNALVLGSAPIIDKINYPQNKEVIQKLQDIIAGSQRLGFLIALFFSIISIIITFNTIKLTIFISKEEIGVMRLVGASKGRVRGPFMIEGAIYGIIATVVTIVLFWPTTVWFGKNMTSFLGFNVYEYYISNLFQIFVIILLSGVVLGMISSYIAVHRYLNK